ncbi:MAG: OmpA family protein [Verrucomicrobia bacterium]|nr:OmpA family protein [Verrucomicrobiota bacterium]
MNRLFLSLSALVASLSVLTGCSHLPGLSSEPAAEVVYALGTRDGFTSPLQSSLKPACPALEFIGSSFQLTGIHRRLLSPLAASPETAKDRYLIAGYAPPGLPEDFARSLSERRAQAARQYLIESGVEAALLQTVGFGFDSAPNAPGANVVVIYRQ